MSEEIHTTPREYLNGGLSHGTTIVPITDDTITEPFVSPEIILDKDIYMRTLQETREPISKPETIRTGINRKFDSITLGIASAICFGLVAGAVAGMWAMPIGIIAGFYIAYKAYQDSAS